MLTTTTRPTRGWRRSALGFVAAAALLAGMAGPVDARTFRWANDLDANSLDPHSRNVTFQLTFLENVYEGLVRRGPDLKLEPSLATSWRLTAPDTWRFELRRNVRFHGGEPFTADDVIFSYQRTITPPSNLNGVFAAVREARKVDDFTVEFVTNGPSPTLPDEMATWMVMSKTWSERNNATVVANMTQQQENFASRNTNGTGPFMIRERVIDNRTVFVPNPNWWDKVEHNLTEVVFSRIQNDATRTAALRSGEVDMVYSIPPQDVAAFERNPQFKVWQTPETRTMYLGLDQIRDELLGSSLKGRNPFKDIRVRQAFHHAIDIEAIKTRVMRGYSNPTGLLVGPGIAGFDPSINTRLPFNVDRARELMREAGYAEGFDVTLNCSNDRYVNDEAICTAIAAMLARINVKVNVVTEPFSRFFRLVNPPSYETSFFLLGWSPASIDAHNALVNLAYTRGAVPNKGVFNVQGHSNPAMDRLTDAIAIETDAAKRLQMMKEALSMARDQHAVLPLHQQVILWASRSTVDLKQLSNNYFPLRLVRMN
ncbi:MAG: ABC transporter substrate-binding protein [Alphaproteobacteria bacterium]|nr:MAG: ABC transporter substrate-binding protein [Alphaproteobacteria bacterium]